MIWLIVIGFPLLICCLLGHARTRNLAAGPGLWLAPLPALGLALFGEGAASGFFPALFLETTLHFGPYGRVFLLLAAVLWTAAGLFAWSAAQSGSGGRDRFRFAFFFLVTLSGNLGVCVAQDLASFYVFFAMMSFAAYGMIVHDQTPKAFHAGKIYLIMTVVGEVLLAAAFFYAGIIADSLLFADAAQALAGAETGWNRSALVFSLALAGFGIKAGVIGLHFWLPLAHPAAPTAASAVLSGVMIKVGLLGWLQLFPLTVGLTLWGMGMAWLGLVGAVYAAAAGFARHDPKTILAYSSVSQMGLMTMGVGFVLAAQSQGGGMFPESGVLPAGILLFVLVHGLAKGALFLGVGVAKATQWGTARARWLLAGLAAAGLVLAGAPFTGGALVKQTLKSGAEQLSPVWSGFFSAVLPLTAVGTTLLMAMFLWRIWRSMAAEDARHEVHSKADKDSGSPKARWGMVFAWGGLLALVLGVVPIASLMFPELYNELNELAGKGWEGVWDGLWPISLGLVAAGLFLRLSQGDGESKGLDDLVLAAVERGATRLRSWWWRSPYCDPACGTIDLVAWSDRILQSRWMQTVPDRIERRLLYWHTVGVLFVGFVLVFLAVTWWSGR
ncbi:complex I subunit 5 family protein [Desulfonatronum thiodismutans]|uniref:complex I subunit 5 family protein n=1 Tax=Desulfonatronum thiodismutans TaxID=159290 RepID=UPI0004ABE750|nr:complex I subunit 5 family protein [Desulfonatronum thiodismutans]